MQKAKFKYNTRGKLRKDEIIEIKRTHKTNIFDWVKAGQRKIQEMDKFEEMVNKEEDMNVMEVQENTLDREVRLQRVKARQQEFLTRKMAKDILGGVLEDVYMFRSTHTITRLLEYMLEEVTEHAVVNNLFKEVMSTGPGAVAKMEEKCLNRFAIKGLVEDLLQRVMEEEARKERRQVQEQKKQEWQIRWDRLEQELAQAMDALQEYEIDMMEIDEQKLEVDSVSRG